MSDSTNEFLSTSEKVLFRCWILGFVVLFVWLGAILLMGDMLLDVHSSMFGISAFLNTNSISSTTAEWASGSWRSLPASLFHDCRSEWC